MTPELLCLSSLIILIYIFIIHPAHRAFKDMGGNRGGRRKRKGTFYIYRLMDGNKPFYVGQTTQKPENRLRQHMNDDSNTDKSLYIHRMRRAPRIEVIDKARNQAEANRLENKYMRKWGLTNMKSA